jgi:hypothetical protein
VDPDRDPPGDPVSDPAGDPTGDPTGHPDREPPGDPDTPVAGSSPWSPPDAGRPTPPPPPGAPRVETDESDGPPLPPPLRARRRRRRIVLAVGVVVAIIAIPVGLGLAGAGFFTLDTNGDGLAADEAIDDERDGDADDDTTGDDGAADPDDGPDGDGDGPDDPIGERPGVSPSLDAPDPAELSGSDAVYAGLLIDVDRSEGVMIGFQGDVADAFGAAGADDDLIGTLRTIASERRDELLEVRSDLLDEVDDDGAELVRQRYLAHLDSWADYMDAVAADPEVLAGEGTAGGFTVVINQTADAFARALDEQLPLDADAEVQDFAEGILDRGFRSSGDAQV